MLSELWVMWIYKVEDTAAGIINATKDKNDCLLKSTLWTII